MRKLDTQQFAAMLVLFGKQQRLGFQRHRVGHHRVPSGIIAHSASNRDCWLPHRRDRIRSRQFCERFWCPFLR